MHNDIRFTTFLPKLKATEQQQKWSQTVRESFQVIKFITQNEQSNISNNYYFSIKCHRKSCNINQQNNHCFTEQFGCLFVNLKRYEVMHFEKHHTNVPQFFIWELITVNIFHSLRDCVLLPFLSLEGLGVLCPQTQG